MVARMLMIMMMVMLLMMMMTIAMTRHSEHTDWWTEHTGWQQHTGHHVLHLQSPLQSFVFQVKMRARLFLLALVASFGYFTFGLAVAWPAAALPDIRFDLICMSADFFHPADSIHFSG